MGMEPYEVVWNRQADGIRLPTESEWEHACRAQTTTNFGFGDGVNGLVGYGWFETNSDSRTHLIRTKRCNAWGLFDIHGNVSEWCWDRIFGSQLEGFIRECCGGSWDDLARDCQSTNNFWSNPMTRSNSLGFRVARGPSSGAESESESEGR